MMDALTSKDEHLTDGLPPDALDALKALKSQLESSTN